MKTEKIKNVPELRFSGFEGVWWKKPLQDLTEKSITYGIVQTGDSIEGGVKCVRVVDLTKPEIILDQLITTTEEISRSYKRTILVEGEIMIALRGEIGLLALVSKSLEGSNLTRGIARVAPKKSVVYPEYLVWALRSDDGRMEFAKQVNGSALKEIPINGLNKVEVQLTTLPEQQKIADFLTAVDGRLAQLSRKKALLEDYKKGVMQQLFTQALRFKDDNGNEFPEWDEKTSFYDLIDQVLDFRGRTPLKLGMEWGSGNIISLSANNVKNGYIDFAAECNFGSQTLYEKWMGGVSLKKGDIVFTMEAPLGQALQIPDDQKYILSQRVVAFKTKKQVLNCFLLQLIWSADFQEQLAKLATGSTAKGINQKSLKMVEVSIPSPPEQTKIANFLTALDRKIEAVTAQITHIQTWKKGLLQQMFV